MIGNVDAARAFSTVHPGAVYLHLGRSYEVIDMDLDARRAMVKPFDGDYYTQAKKETEVFIDDTDVRRSTLGVELNFGSVSVSEQVIAFQRKRLGDNEVLETVALDLSGPGLRHPGPLVRDRRTNGVPPADGGPARRTSRLRARADRRPAPDRDVRPLGHRRPLDQRPHADRAADDLHLRRPPGRHRHHAARLRGVRAAGRRRRPPYPRMPLRGRLPLLRPEPEVRKPERAPPQGRARWS